jgi:hypothetical protein
MGWCFAATLVYESIYFAGLGDRVVDLSEGSLSRSICSFSNKMCTNELASQNWAQRNRRFALVLHGRVADAVVFFTEWIADLLRQQRDVTSQSRGGPYSECCTALFSWYVNYSISGAVPMANPTRMAMSLTFMMYSH